MRGHILRLFTDLGSGNLGQAAAFRVSFVMLDFVSFANSLNITREDRFQDHSKYPPAGQLHNGSSSVIIALYYGLPFIIVCCCCSHSAALERCIRTNRSRFILNKYVKKSLLSSVELIYSIKTFSGVRRVKYDVFARWQVLLVTVCEIARSRYLILIHGPWLLVQRIRSRVAW